MILQTGSGPLYFELAGERLQTGRTAISPLVFISGWAMSCECWRPAVKLLSKKKRQCLIYDTRGVARSQPVAVNASFTVEDHAEDLHRIIEAVGIFDAVLVAHDLGAMVAAALARAHPQDVNSVVIVSPRPGLAAEDVRSLAVFTPASLALRELAEYPLIRSLVQRRFRRAPKPYRDRMYSDFAQLSPRGAYETALSASNPDSLVLVQRLVERGLLRSLLVCGDKDKRGTAEARRLFKRSERAQLATLRDCGFLPMLEYPSQFAKLIERFVQPGRGAAPPGRALELPE
jgi:pimeloyl-ACP methyl ester carboxylesterase